MNCNKENFTTLDRSQPVYMGSGITASTAIVPGGINFPWNTSGFTGYSGEAVWWRAGMGAC